jgi:trk system potassium uptake protein TrkA
MYIVVAGGGMVGGGLIKTLLENKHDVVLIEQNKELCEKMYAETGVVAVCGSASQIEILKDAKIEKADVFVAATASDPHNLAAAIMAKSFNVPRVIVRMRDTAYENAYKVAGVNTILAVTDLMVNQMIIEIEQPEVQKIATIGSGKADIFRITVPQNAKVAGKTVRDITTNKKFPSACTFLGVYNKRNDEFTIPRGDRIINQGDELFLVSTAENIKEAADFLTG